MTRDDWDGDRRERYDKRRRLAAECGRHLPTVEELLSGFPFLGGSVDYDAQIFAERVLPRIPEAENGACVDLRKAMEALTVFPSELHFRHGYAAFMAVAEELKVIEQPVFDDEKGRFLTIPESHPSMRHWDSRTRRRIPNPAMCAVRCAFYAAAAGSAESAWIVATEAVSLAITARTDADVPEYVASAVGWLAVAARLAPLAGERLGHPSRSTTPHVAVMRHGAEVMERIFRNDVADGQVADSRERGRRSTAPKGSLLDDDNAPWTEEGGSSAVVFVSVGNLETADGKRVKREFEDVLGKRLPLVDVPDLVAVRRVLVAEFPYAATVIDAILTPMATCDHVRFRPTVLVGDPSSGKTTFAERLLAVLGVKSETYFCGGVSDPALAGTPRRWSTGEPSLPVALARRWKSASPGIVLDEVEKVATSRHNGNLLDALLGLMEPQSSMSWHDPYLEAPCDLSHILWMATANSLDGVPRPLRDRCRIIRFPNPGPADIETLAAALLKRIVAEQGLDPRWARPLDPEELNALRAVWTGGSVRRLARLVEGVLSVRGQESGVQ